MLLENQGHAHTQPEMRRGGMFDVYVIEDEGLLVGRFKGTLDFAKPRELWSSLRSKNATSKLDSIVSVTLPAWKGSVSRPRRSQNWQPAVACLTQLISVSTAFLATDSLASGITHMYAEFLSSGRIEVRVFAELAAAAEWLAVLPQRLTLLLRHLWKLILESDNWCQLVK